MIIPDRNLESQTNSEVPEKGTVVVGDDRRYRNCPDHSTCAQAERAVPPTGSTYGERLSDDAVGSAPHCQVACKGRSYKAPSSTPSNCFSCAQGDQLGRLVQASSLLRLGGAWGPVET
jgi:hypothetical protein